MEEGRDYVEEFLQSSHRSQDVAFISSRVIVVALATRALTGPGELVGIALERVWRQEHEFDSVGVGPGRTA